MLTNSLRLGIGWHPVALLQHGVRGHFPTVAGPEDDGPHGQVYVFGYHGQEKAHATRPHSTG
jgi:hypothetical protein